MYGYGNYGLNGGYLDYGRGYGDHYGGYYGGYAGGYGSYGNRHAGGYNGGGYPSYNKGYGNKGYLSYDKSSTKSPILTFVKGFKPGEHSFTFVHRWAENSR